jgi:DNA polymerase III delta prime subunit
MSTFGQMLRRYRRQCRDPLRGGMLTQERFGELIGFELGDAGYSGAAVSDWERDKSRIAVDDRLVLVSLVGVLHKCEGLATPAEADELLATGGYRALNESERRRAFPDWRRPEATAVAESPAKSEAGRREDGALSSRKRRKKLILLQKVRNFWIGGVLERSLQLGMHLELALLREDDTVDHPWREVVGPALYDAQRDSGQGQIAQLFEDCDRALAILGEAGSGKTTTLLALARELVARAERSPAEAIPVILNLASWSESRAPIDVWLVEELTAKYQIPRGTGRKWLQHDELLFLLDGFDEVPPTYRDACAQGINRFRREHGLAGIVICGRSEAFQVTKTKLKLGGAVAIQPLSNEQVERYLEAAGPVQSELRSALQDDGRLREMSQTPLMLQVMAVAYDEADMPTGENRGGLAGNQAKRRELFNAYTRAMFHRRTEHERYTAERTTYWLASLARQMLAHNRSIFLIEEMQPTWLHSRGWQWLYLLLFGLSNGLFAGIILWLFLLLLRQTTPDLPADFSSHIASLLGIPLAWAEFTTLVAGNVLLGLLVATIIGVIFERRRGQGGPVARHSWWEWPWLRL